MLVVIPEIPVAGVGLLRNGLTGPGIPDERMNLVAIVILGRFHIRIPGLELHFLHRGVHQILQLCLGQFPVILQGVVELALVFIQFMQIRRLQHIDLQGRSGFNLQETLPHHGIEHGRDNHLERNIQVERGFQGRQILAHLAGLAELGKNQFGRRPVQVFPAHLIQPFPGLDHGTLLASYHTEESANHRQPQNQ